MTGTRHPERRDLRGQLLGQPRGRHRGHVERQPGGRRGVPGMVRCLFGNRSVHRDDGPSPLGHGELRSLTPSGRVDRSLRRWPVDWQRHLRSEWRWRFRDEIVPGQTESFYIRVQNDGQQTDSFTLRGPTASPGYVFSYYRGGKNITSVVAAGTFKTQSLAPASVSKAIRVKVKVRSSTPHGSLATFAFGWVSMTVPSRADVTVAYVAVRNTEFVRRLPPARLWRLAQTQES